MGRSPPCSKEGMNRGAWTALEDKILTDYIKIHGERKWGKVSKEAGLKRCGKSCRLRWLNYLRPGIKRGNISHDEDDLIIRLHKLLGNRWSLIAGRLPGRTDNEIKNYWHSNLSKRPQEKESNQPKIEIKSMIRPPHKASPEAGLIPAKPSGCTRVVETTQEHKHKFNDTKVAVVPSKIVASESESSDGSLLLVCKDKNLSDFTMDFNIGGICPSEILNPDFPKLTDHDFTMHDFNNVAGDDTNNRCKSELSPFSDQELLVSEEMVENWIGSDYVETGMDSNFQSLASFFESAGDEWLGDDLNIVYPN